MPTAPDPSQDQPITRSTILDVAFEHPTVTSRVEIREIRILAGHAGGLHIHNGPVVGSIVEGSVIYQIEGEPERVLGPGEVFFEPEGARIARFDAQEDGVTFLGYFLLRAGQEPGIDFPQA